MTTAELNPMEVGEMESLREMLYWLMHHHHWNDDCRNVDSDMSHSPHHHHWSDDCKNVMTEPPGDGGHGKGGRKGYPEEKAVPSAAPLPLE